MTADELAVEPGGGLGIDLPIERDGGVHRDDNLAPLALVIGGGTLQEITWDLPVVAIEPVNDAGSTQRLQAPDMGLDVPSTSAGMRVRSRAEVPPGS
jgi:hypothetical protein